MLFAEADVHVFLIDLDVFNQVLHACRTYMYYIVDVETCEVVDVVKYRHWSETKIPNRLFNIL